MQRFMQWAAGVWLAGALLLMPNAAHTQSETPTFGTTVVVPFGLRGRIYFVPPHTGSLPMFSALDPVGVIYTPTLDISNRPFKQGFPGVTDRLEWFAIDYTGRFWIERPGGYKFTLTSDDGAKLYIDGRLEIDNDGVHSARARSNSLFLSGGIHRIRVSYFQGPGAYIALMLALTGPDGERQVFSTDRFKPPSDPEQWKYGSQGELTPSSPSTTDSPVAPKAQKAFVAGDAELADGNVKDAKKHLEHAAKVYPDYAQAWSALGQVWEIESNKDKARQAYERALAANPDYVVAAVRLASLDLAERRDEDALRVTSRAIARPQVDNPLIYFYDAIANAHLKDSDAAVKSARRAIELDTAHEAPSAEYLLGMLLGEQGDVPGALEHMRRYLAIAPNAKDFDAVQARIAALDQTAPTMPH